MAASTMPDSGTFEPFGRRLQLFTGKGGVGKSTIVAGLAVAAARHRHRPLIVELGHRATMSTLFRRDAIGFEPQPVGAGVWACNVQMTDALVAYVAEHLRVPGIGRMMLANDVLRRFLETAPGVVEVLTLNRLRSLVSEATGDQPTWHPIFVDLDATGHALMMLELPRTLDGLVGAGPLRRLLSGVTTLVTDPELTALNLVAIPRELAVEETLELYQALRGDHRVPLGALIVNSVRESPLGAAARSALQAVEVRAPETLVRDVAIGRRSLRQESAEIELVGRLQRALPLPTITVPRLAAPPLGVEALGALARALVPSR